MTGYDEERIGELLRRLPPAPADWVQAAQQLPGARRCIDQIVALAEEDAAYRQLVLDDLEAALRQVGMEPVQPLLEELRRRLPSD